MERSGRPAIIDDRRRPTKEPSMLEDILITTAGVLVAILALAAFGLIIWAAAQDGRTAAGVRPLRSRHAGLKRRSAPLS
jgi:hypothetical protein